MIKTLVPATNLTDQFVNSKVIKTLGPGSELIIYIDYTKGTEDYVEIKVLVSHTDQNDEYYVNLHGTKEMVYSLVESNKYRKAIKIYEPFAIISFKGVGANISGSIKIGYQTC